MYRCLIALLLLATTAASAAPVWTWIDAEGRRHFSDRPVDGATRIDLPDSPGRAMPSVTATSPAADARQSQSAPRETTPPIRYTRFDIVSPENEATLWNIGATLPLQLAIEPGLQPNHVLDVVMDGERIELGARSASLTIPEVYRGLHTIQAMIVDASTGREVLRTQPVTIMVQQTTLLNPNNPNR